MVQVQHRFGLLQRVTSHALVGNVIIMCERHTMQCSVYGFQQWTK